MYYFKRQKLLWIIYLCGSFSFIYLLSIQSVIQYAAFWELANLAILTTCIIFLIKTRMYSKKLANSYFVKCNPETYEQKAKEVSESHFTFRLTRDSYRFSRIYALQDCGKLEEADAELHQINIRYLRKRIRTIDLEYMQLLTSYYLQNNKEEEALKTIAKMKELADKLCKHNSLIPLINEITNGTEAMYYFYKKKYEKCQSYYLQTYHDLHTTIRDRVHCAYNLSEIYLSQDPLRAKAFLNYVITYGNKIYLVKLAEEKFKQFSTQDDLTEETLENILFSNPESLETPSEQSLKYSANKYRVSSKRGLFVLFFIGLTVGAIILGSITNRMINDTQLATNQALTEEQKSPDYAIKDFLPSLNLTNAEYKYLVIDDFLFVSTKKVSFQGVKTEKGGFEFVLHHNINLPVITKDTDDFMSTILVKNLNGEYSISIDISLLNENKDSLKVYDNTGTDFSVIGDEVGYQKSWVKVLKGIPDGYKIFVEYNGNSYEVLNKETILENDINKKDKS